MTREVVDCPICIMPLEWSTHADDDGDQILDPTISRNCKPANTNHSSCSVANESETNYDSFLLPSRLPPTPATSFSASGSSAVPSADVRDEFQSSKNSVLLSCSHIFHKKCLESFERFSLDSIAKTCPICRSTYVKKTI